MVVTETEHARRAKAMGVVILMAIALLRSLIWLGAR